MCEINARGSADGVTGCVFVFASFIVLCQHESVSVSYCKLDIISVLSVE